MAAPGEGNLDRFLRSQAAKHGERGYGRIEMKLAVVWGCVTLLTQRLQALPVQIIDQNGRPVNGRPAWMRGRGEWDWDDMLAASCWSFLMRGNCFLRPRKSDGNSVTTYVGIVHPDVVSANVPEQKMREGLSDLPELLVGGKKARLIQGRWMTEPGNWRGLSAIEAARRAAYIGEAASDAITGHFKRGVRKQGALVTDQTLGRRNKKETLAQMRSRWSGVDQWWDPIVLDQGLKWIDLSMSAADAEFIGLSNWNDAKIAAQIFHVDPSLLGIKQEGSSLVYRNAIDREAQLWRDALRPLATKIENLFSELLPTGQRLDFDERGLVTGSPKDRLEQAERMAKINMMTKSWTFSADDIRERAGLLPTGIMPEPLQLTSPDQMGALIEQMQNMMLAQNHESNPDTVLLNSGDFQYAD